MSRPSTHARPPGAWGSRFLLCALLSQAALPTRATTRGATVRRIVGALGALRRWNGEGERVVPAPGGTSS